MSPPCNSCVPCSKLILWCFFMWKAVYFQFVWGDGQLALVSTATCFLGQTEGHFGNRCFDVVIGLIGMPHWPWLKAFRKTSLCRNWYSMIQRWLMRSYTPQRSGLGFSTLIHVGTFEIKDIVSFYNLLSEDLGKIAHSTILLRHFFVSVNFFSDVYQLEDVVSLSL